MTSKAYKPTVPATVLDITNTHVTVSLEDTNVSLPKTLFTESIAVGDTVYVGLFSEKEHSEHHEKLSKSILNSIFSNRGNRNDNESS